MTTPPVFVGAGSGVALTTGTGTVSKTGCTAGNLIVVHLVTRGSSEDWSAFSNEANVEQLDGTLDHFDGIQTGLGIGSGATSRQHLFAARVTADGTCSGDFTVGASGEDMYARMYEFSGASRATTVAGVFENDTGIYAALDGTSTTVADIGVVTRGYDRLALMFTAVAANQAVAAFTGETGGDWTEAIAEYATATGAAATLQLQTAPMPVAGTIDGGTLTISSAGWGVVGVAIRPDDGEVFPSTPILDDFSGTLANWTNSTFGDGDLTLYSGAVGAPGAGQWGGGLWTPIVGVDQEAYATFPTYGPSQWLWVRCTWDVSAQTTGYGLLAGPNSWTLSRCIGGGFTTIAEDVPGTFTFNNGDSYGISAIGSRITAYRKVAGGSWRVLASVQNTDITQSGRIGLEVENEVARADNFGGGNLTAAPTNPILDHFNRADGAPGALWEQAIDTYSMPNVSGNALDWPQYPSLAWAAPFAANQEVFVKMLGITEAGLLLRLNNPNTGTETGYFFEFYPWSGGGPVSTYRINNGYADMTLLNYENNIVPETNRWFWATAVGTTLSLYGSDDGIYYTLIKEVEDSAFQESGQIGLWERNNTTVGYDLDDFGGGTLSYPFRDAVLNLNPVGYFPLSGTYAEVGTDLTVDTTAPGAAAAHVAGGPGASSLVRNLARYYGANEPSMEFKADVPFTMVFWVKPDAGNTDSTDYNLMSMRSDSGTLPGWQILQGYATTDKLSFVFDEGAAGEDEVAISNVFTNGVLTFTSLTFDGTTLRGFRNAAEVGSATPSKAIGDMGSALFRVGANQSGNNGITGELSEIVFFDRVLTDTEIRTLYQAGDPLAKFGTGASGRV